MAREIRNDQNYVDKLLRLIPSEIVAAYLIISGIIPVQYSKWGHLIVSGIILLIIPFYMWRVQNVSNKMQIMVTAIAFIVWMYSLNGGPFYPWGLYKPWIASIALILWTVIVPILIVEKDEESVNMKKTVNVKRNLVNKNKSKKRIN